MGAYCEGRTRTGSSGLAPERGHDGSLSRQAGRRNRTMMVTNRRFAMVNLALDSEWADLALWTNGVANTAFYGRRISLVSIRSHGKSASRVNAAVIAGHNCTVVCGRNWHQGALANATDLMRCCHGVRCENSTRRCQNSLCCSIATVGLRSRPTSPALSGDPMPNHGHL